MEKFPSLQNFYTHAVTGVTDNYQVCAPAVGPVVFCCGGVSGPVLVAVVVTLVVVVSVGLSQGF